MTWPVVQRLNNSARASRRGRKGEGRPKGKLQVKRRSGPAPDVEQRDGGGYLYQGNALEQVTSDFAMTSVQHAKIAVARDEGRRKILTQLLDAAAATNFS